MSPFGRFMRGILWLWTFNCFRSTGLKSINKNPKLLAELIYITVESLSRGCISDLFQWSKWMQLKVEIILFEWITFFCFSLYVTCTLSINQKMPTTKQFNWMCPLFNTFRGPFVKDGDISEKLSHWIWTQAAGNPSTKSQHISLLVNFCWRPRLFLCSQSKDTSS